MASRIVTNNPADGKSEPAIIFDREEGNMNPGVGGLPAAIIRGIAADQAAIRKATGTSPMAFRSASQPPVRH